LERIYPRRGRQAARHVNVHVDRVVAEALVAM
jgi:hypothetical protein